MKGQKLPPIFLLLCTLQQVDPGLPATNLIPHISPPTLPPPPILLPGIESPSFSVNKDDG